MRAPDAGEPTPGTGTRGAQDRHEVRAAVARFLTAGLVALVLVAVPIVLWVRAEAERHALANARDVTQRLADNVVGPLISDKVLAREPAALEHLGQRLAPWLSETGVTGIKVWDEHGRVVYSDAGSFGRRSVEQDQRARRLLAGGPATATLASRTAEDDAHEDGPGERVEVYVRSASQSGAPMIFETYSSGEGVRREQRAVLMGVMPPVLLALAALQLTQLVPAVRLARRIQAHRAARTALLRCAIESSDQERRRIAGELHDEVIQDLSGLAYALESEERCGPPGMQPVFRNARTMLQANLRTLRAMTTELYPPDLAELGLEAAVLRLQAPLAERGTSLTVEIPETLVLDRDRAALLFRVAREALANVAKHSSARSVALRIRQAGRMSEIRIADDGVGFDPGEVRAECHLGLRILADTVHQAGGTLDVRSVPGAGTSVTATFGAPAPGASITRASSAGSPAAGVAMPRFRQLLPARKS